MILLISYDLNGQDRPSSYAAVTAKIKEKAIDWHKPLYSQWWVDTTHSADTWMKWLEPIIDSDDRVFIDRVTREHQGGLHRNRGTG